ncbi:hypothetical protein PQR46_14865 [Paraburkholderia sediminicola]|uniref:hypothetical protein n=1 Tax=Paraburkholderia sediminicola TaxID=458836 RepID=UPI0038BB73F0
MGFSDVAVKWGNVLFFAFHAVAFWFGFFWRYVEECDWGPAGLGVWWFFRFSYLILVLVLVFLYCLWLF